MSGFLGSTGSTREPGAWGLRESWRGRREGIANSTSEASENCTSMCRHVVNNGKGKMFVASPSPLASLNIHLL